MKKDEGSLIIESRNFVVYNNNNNNSNNKIFMFLYLFIKLTSTLTDVLISKSNN